MKNIRVFASLLFIPMILLSGCNDWLDLEPENSLIKEDFWLEKEDIEAVVAASYGALANNSLTDYLFWSELRGGLVSPGTNALSNQNIMEFYDFNITENNPYVKWDAFYKVINLCNSVLANADGVALKDPDLSTEEIQFFKGEALALRSMCYLQLVKTYKEVPLILEPFEDDANDVQTPKEQESVIMEQIIEDLKQAHTWAIDKYEEPIYNLGRIRKLSVSAILADAYLWNNDYQKCVDVCDEIIESYQFGLVNGRHYLDIFSEGNTSEGIFELQYDHSINQTNNLYSLTANFPNGYMIISDYTKELFGSNLDYRGDGASVDFSTGSIWKYIGKEQGDVEEKRGSGESDANWIFYRLADINLMKAEALGELGEFKLAMEPLNLIRARAGLNPLVESSETMVFMDLLLEERARELIGEGKRWFDLVRIARRDVNNRRFLIFNNVLRNVSPQYVSSVEDKISDVNSWFLPIYFNELKTNKRLVQNEFYKRK